MLYIRFTAAQCECVCEGGGMGGGGGGGMGFSCTSHTLPGQVLGSGEY